MANWKQLAWHLVRLGLAAILLAWDVRVFLFYAFTILLMAIHHINHLRALVRVLSIGHDAKLIAIYECLGLTKEHVLQINERIEADLTAKQLRSLREDYELVMRR